MNRDIYEMFLLRNIPMINIKIVVKQQSNNRNIKYGADINYVEKGKPPSTILMVPFIFPTEQILQKAIGDLFMTANNLEAEDLVL